MTRITPHPIPLSSEAGNEKKGIALRSPFPAGEGGQGVRFSAAAPGFTLLETMVAIAILSFALLGLLGLHHQGLMSIIRAQATTEAAMLAQTIMAETEVESRQWNPQEWPVTGSSQGKSNNAFPGRFANFVWQRTITQSPEFPDLAIVNVMVVYGPALSEKFTMTEYLHNPFPLPNPLEGPQ
ncbi:MAG: type IV pilus modification PilV family protein [Candidatus Binataceae bacterium]